MIMINNDFIANVAVQILALGYHEDEKEYGAVLAQINKSITNKNVTSKIHTINMSKSRMGLPSISIGKSSLQNH